LLRPDRVARGQRCTGIEFPSGQPVFGSLWAVFPEITPEKRRSEKAWVCYDSPCHSETHPNGTPNSRQAWVFLFFPGWVVDLLVEGSVERLQRPEVAS
jgi:hypothetical protein